MTLSPTPPLNSQASTDAAHPEAGTQPGRSQDGMS
jgi:hypothetical protein